MRLKIFKGEDRLTVASILVKNNYRVSQGKAKNATGKSYTYFIDAEEQEVEK